MRPSFNSRGNAFVVCHVTWRFLKTGEMYPRENNETFISFLFTSFHFAALPHPISFRDPDQAAPRLAHVPGGASQPAVSSNITTRDRAWHARSSFRKCWDERKRNRTWIFKAFVNFGRFLSRNRKLMDSLNEFANILYTDFPSIFWRLVFLYGQRETTERERRKEVLEQTMTLLMSLWGEIWKKISFSQSWKSGTSAHGIIYFTSAISRFPFVYIANI